MRLETTTTAPAPGCTCVGAARGSVVAGPETHVIHPFGSRTATPNVKRVLLSVSLHLFLMLSRAFGHVSLAPVLRRCHFSSRSERGPAHPNRRRPRTHHVRAAVPRLRQWQGHFRGPLCAARVCGRCVATAGKGSASRGGSCARGNALTAAPPSTTPHTCRRDRTQTGRHSSAATRSSCHRCGGGQGGTGALRGELHVGLGSRRQPRRRAHPTTQQRHRHTLALPTGRAEGDHSPQAAAAAGVPAAQ